MRFAQPDRRGRALLPGSHDGFDLLVGRPGRRLARREAA